jgi:hypothetical protein
MVIPAKSWKPSFVNSAQVILLMSTTILSSAAAGAASDNRTANAMMYLDMLPPVVWSASGQRSTYNLLI